MVSDKDIFRVIDVNINRSKEGLRVIEDIFRFVIKDDKLRKSVRKIRHELDSVLLAKVVPRAIFYRDVSGDLGKRLDGWEKPRDNLEDIVYANFQRVKEALRVLEEFLKLVFPNKVAKIKAARFKVYKLERTLKFYEA